MKALLFSGRFVPVKGLFFAICCLVSIACSSETADVKLIPRPAEMEVFPGFFIPEDPAISVDSLVTGRLDAERMEQLGLEGYELSVFVDPAGGSFRSRALLRTAYVGAVENRCGDPVCPDHGSSAFCLSGCASGCFPAFLSQEAHLENVG